MPSPLDRRDVDPGVAEADDVSAAVTGDIGEEAGVPVDPPAAGLGAEVVDGRHGRVGEGAVSVGQRDVDAGVAEPDDVGAAVTGDVRQQPQMGLDPPPLVVAEVGQDEVRVGERPTVRRERRPHPRVAEADDVGPASSGEIGG